MPRRGEDGGGVPRTMMIEALIVYKFRVVLNRQDGYTSVDDGDEGDTFMVVGCSPCYHVSRFPPFVLGFAFSSAGCDARVAPHQKSTPYTALWETSGKVRRETN